MIYLYTFLYALTLAFYLPFFWLRFKWLKGERLEISSRLCLSLPPPSGGKPCLWFHAVSVGEVLSLQRLIQQLKQRHPSWRIFFTSLTPTGIRLARKKIGSEAEVAALPLDLPLCLNRFLKQIRPRLLVLAESEFWPNLIRLNKQNSVPVVVINGRIGAKSFQRMKKFRSIFLPILNKIDLYLVQSARDKQRLIEVGVNSQKIFISGNLKSDVELPPLTEEGRMEWRHKLGIGAQDKVMTAGSTHRGEEQILIEAFFTIKKEKPDLKLIIAPRHPQRGEEIGRLCQQLAIAWEKWSVWRSQSGFRQNKGWEILIIDTLGELPLFYGLADLTFIGGSLVRRGGHNLLEPAFYGRPIIFGPHMDNFASLTQEFLEKEAAFQVEKKEDLLQAFLDLEQEKFKKMGERAKLVLKSLQGATEKTISVLEEFMLKEAKRI